MPFLHFHNGPDRAYADVRFGGDFEPVTAYPARRTLICVAGRPASSGVLGACVEQSDNPEEPVEALAMAGGLPKFTATVCICRRCFTDRRPTESSTAGLSGHRSAPGIRCSGNQHGAVRGARRKSAWPASFTARGPFSCTGDSTQVAGGRPYEELHPSSWPAAVSLRCAGRRLTRSSSTNPDYMALVGQLVSR
jgi:hypothetical protein